VGQLGIEVAAAVDGDEQVSHPVLPIGPADPPGLGIEARISSVMAAAVWSLVIA